MSKIVGIWGNDGNTLNSPCLFSAKRKTITGCCKDWRSICFCFMSVLWEGGERWGSQMTDQSDTQLHRTILTHLCNPVRHFCRICLCVFVFYAFAWQPYLVALVWEIIFLLFLSIHLSFFLVVIGQGHTLTRFIHCFDGAVTRPFVVLPAPAHVCQHLIKKHRITIYFTSLPFSLVSYFLLSSKALKPQHPEVSIFPGECQIL